MYFILIDDHKLLTESIRNLLQSEIDGLTISTYRNGAAFLQDKHDIHPDIVITDLIMSGNVNGIKVLDFCFENFGSNTKTLVLSSINNGQIVRQAIKSGASGFLSKSAQIYELFEAIKLVRTGKQYISSDLRDELLNTIFIEDQMAHHLSPREKDVLQLVCNGKTMKEIANDLKLSIYTVQYYHRSILSKLNVKKTSTLIVLAMQKGLYIPEAR